MLISNIALLDMVWAWAEDWVLGEPRNLYIKQKTSELKHQDDGIMIPEETLLFKLRRRNAETDSQAGSHGNAGKIAIYHIENEEEPQTPPNK